MHAVALQLALLAPGLNSAHLRAVNPKVESSIRQLAAFPEHLLLDRDLLGGTQEWLDIGCATCDTERAVGFALFLPL